MGLIVQSGTATISGIVQDSHHAAVPGARISVRHSETNATRELRVEFDGVPPVQSGVEHTLGQVLRTEVHLQLAAVADSVNVSTADSRINTAVEAIKGDILHQQEINDMPLDGRDFTDLAFLVSGVVPVAQGGQGSGLNVDGARSESTNDSIDGINNRNPHGGAAQVRPNGGAMQ